MNRFLIAITQTLEQFEHATLGIVKAKLVFDPRNRFFRAANVFIEPGGELLKLRGIKRGGIANVVEGTQGVDTRGSKGVYPALEGLRMQMQDGRDVSG